jgi:protein-disulfide isomerase
MARNTSQGTKKIRQSRKERRRKARQRQQLRLLGIVAVIAAVFAALLIYPNVAPITNIVEVELQEYPNPDGREMGDPDAPVVIEVFEDFQCPACAFFNEDLKGEIITNFVETGQARLVFRNFPFLDDRVPGSESDQAANAALCAAEQDRFWDYHDMLFANQNGENRGAYADRRLIAFADTIGLEESQFRSCFNESRYQSTLDADIALAQEYVVTGTPSVHVNGAKVTTNLASITAAVNAALPSE